MYYCWRTIIHIRQDIQVLALSIEGYVNAIVPSDQALELSVDKASKLQ